MLVLVLVLGTSTSTGTCTSTGTSTSTSTFSAYIARISMKIRQNSSLGGSPPSGPPRNHISLKENLELVLVLVLILLMLLVLLGEAPSELKSKLLILLSTHFGRKEAVNGAP